MRFVHVHSGISFASELDQLTLRLRTPWRRWLHWLRHPRLLLRRRSGVPGDLAIIVLAAVLVTLARSGSALSLGIVVLAALALLLIALAGDR